MPVLVRVWDGDIVGHSLDVGSNRATLRELLRARIEAEVERYNASLPEVFR